MVAWKVVMYGTTVAFAFLASWKQQRLRKELTDAAVANSSQVGGNLLTRSFHAEYLRERRLNQLSGPEKRTHRFFVIAQFVFLGLLFAEVLIFEK